MPFIDDTKVDGPIHVALIGFKPNSLDEIMRVEKASWEARRSTPTDKIQEQKCDFVFEYFPTAIDLENFWDQPRFKAVVCATRLRVSPNQEERCDAMGVYRYCAQQHIECFYVHNRPNKPEGQALLRVTKKYHLPLHRYQPLHGRNQIWLHVYQWLVKVNQPEIPKKKVRSQKTFSCPPPPMMRTRPVVSFAYLSQPAS